MTPFLPNTSILLILKIHIQFEGEFLFSLNTNIDAFCFVLFVCLFVCCFFFITIRWMKYDNIEYYLFVC